MKVTLTDQEIIAKFGLPADTELVIEQYRENDGWISNVGRDFYGHPYSLPDNTEIEVKYRCGKTSIGRASDWHSDWKETDGDKFVIVAYRILNMADDF